MMQYSDWVQAILSVVLEITDRDFQERVWLRGEGPEVSSWDEMICRLFDDYDVDNFVDNHMDKAGLTDQQQKALRSLRDELNAYSDYVDDPCSDHDILVDPKWHRIRDVIGKDALTAFRAK